MAKTSSPRGGPHSHGQSRATRIPERGNNCAHTHTGHAYRHTCIQRCLRSMPVCTFITEVVLKCGAVGIPHIVRHPPCPPRIPHIVRYPLARFGTLRSTERPLAQRSVGHSRGTNRENMRPLELMAWSTQASIIRDVWRGRCNAPVGSCTIGPNIRRRCRAPPGSNLSLGGGADAGRPRPSFRNRGRRLGPAPADRVFVVDLPGSDSGPKAKP